MKRREFLHARLVGIAAASFPWISLYDARAEADKKSRYRFACTPILLAWRGRN